MARSRLEEEAPRKKKKKSRGDEEAPRKKKKKKRVMDEEEEAPMRAYTWANLSQKTELDHDLIELIAEYVSKGHSFRDVSDRYCISYTKLFAWRHRGELYLAGDENPEYEMEAKFVLAMRAASGHYGIQLTNRIHTDDDWNRAFKIAERRMPEVYGANPSGGADDTFSSEEQYL